MPNKEKFKRIATVIEAYLRLPISDTTNFIDIKNGFGIYANALDSLVKKDKLKTLLATQKNLSSSKMVQSAKNLSKQFEMHTIEHYTDCANNILAGIANLNGKSKLTPIREDILNVISTELDALQNREASFYDNLFIDIFNLGRQHQDVVGPKDNLRNRFKKYASFTMVENDRLEKTTNFLKAELFSSIQELLRQSDYLVEMNFEQNADKKRLLNNLQENFSKYSFDVERLFRNHCWKIYSAGNLHQLAKDNSVMVRWQTGHFAHDCSRCRSLETGDDILSDKSSNYLPHRRNVDKVAYQLSDIMPLCELEGPSFFTHDDCRCFFVKTD